MSVTQQLYRNSVYFLILIPIFAIWGFWITYLLRPSGTLTAYDHLHGIAMVGWCLLLISQAFLIRTARGGLHRAMGKLSFVWAPYVIVSTIVLGHYRLNVRGLTPEGLYLIAIQLFLLVQFTVCYVLAIRHRKQRDRHARFMICTALPLLDPIFARILAVNFIHAEFSSGIIQYITFAFTDLILVGLIVWDWRDNRRVDVFLPLLPFFLATQLPLFFVLDWPAWTAFAEWFMQLPLSAAAPDMSVASKF